ncbi:MAG: cobalt-precorrin-5B (C(1))-methyltransferase [Desulfobacterium sp.]|nr:cobalt-precorrin-5B (C(1))-methyltransferase [Desulfobacterium sp.]
MTQEGLRPGFTTGSAAAAAAKAALYYLLSKEPRDRVEIRFLTNEVCVIEINRSKILSASSAESFVIKDAGDDPDVTHRAEIGARVSISEKEGTGSITLLGGRGVGVVTKPGLEVEVGRPAINSGPEQMIREAVKDLLMEFHRCDRDVTVEIVVPKGEELAEKTLNARLGILGGISILGTTGIVRPMSHDAYIATICSGIRVAEAMAGKTLVFTTGRRSERFAMDLFPGLPEEAFIQTGDFFKASLEAVGSAPGITQVIITVFFGKAVKMAMGFPHTHAAKSELTMKTLSGWAREVTSDETLAENIAGSNTARHAFTYIHPLHPDLICRVGEEIKASAQGFCHNRGKIKASAQGGCHNREEIKASAQGGCHNRVAIRAVIFDFEGRVVFDSDLSPKRTP